MIESPSITCPCCQRTAHMQAALMVTDRLGPLLQYRCHFCGWSRFYQPDQLGVLHMLKGDQARFAEATV